MLMPTGGRFLKYIRFRLSNIHELLTLKSITSSPTKELVSPDLGSDECVQMLT